MRLSPARAHRFASSRTLRASGQTTSLFWLETPAGSRKRRAGDRRFPSSGRSTICWISGVTPALLEGEYKTKLHWGMEGRLRQGSGAQAAPLLFDLGKP